MKKIVASTVLALGILAAPAAANATNDGAPNETKTGLSTRHVGAEIDHADHPRRYVTPDTPNGAGKEIDPIGVRKAGAKIGDASKPRPVNR